MTDPTMFRVSPVMSCCGARNFLTLPCKNFDRGHSLCLASSATGSARQRPHFDTSPYIKAARFATFILYFICFRLSRILALKFKLLVRHRPYPYCPTNALIALTNAGLRVADILFINITSCIPRSSTNCRRVPGNT